MSDRTNPLLEMHERAQAEFQSYGDLAIVQTFGEPQAEYAAIRKSAAILDMAHRGVLELTGPDRLSFLNNLLTNQTWDKETKTGLAAGAGVYGFFLNALGRITADMNVLELGSRTLLEMDLRLLETVRQALEKYRFSEKVVMTSRGEDLHCLFVTGSGALAAINRAAESPVGTLWPLECAVRRLLGHEVVVFRDDPCAAPGYGLIVPTAGIAEVWTCFTASPAGTPQSSGDLVFRGIARPAGWAAYNATRIEGGRPLFGVDFDESVLPAETGQMTRAVSLTKGCYLGQEIVARMHARNQVARQIVGVRMEGDALPIAGNKVYDAEGNEIGGVTSSTISPVLSNAPLCLALLKRPFFAIGTRVAVPAEGAMREGVVTELPFVE